MGKRTAGYAIGLMAISAIGVAIYSLRYLAVLANSWPLIDEGIRSVVVRVPVQALTHMLVAPIALLVGALQFVPSIRAGYPKAHRYLGRIYVLSCLIAGVGALATAPHASGGPIAGWGFGVLAVLWIGTSLGGFVAAVRRRFELHRFLMRLSYAMTFGAVTLRLQIPIGFALGYASYPAMSVWLAYTCWIPNVILTAIYCAFESTKRRSGPKEPFAAAA